MAHLTFRESVNYPPWIGRQYGRSESLRLLIVGRSYYDARYQDSTINDFMQEMIKGRKKDNFFTSLEMILSDRRHWKNAGRGTPVFDRKKFWNSICYHQYLQGILEESWSQPGRSMWKFSQDIFKKVLITLEPDLIVFLGFDIYDNMPTLGGKRGLDFEEAGDTLKSWIFEIGDRPAMACRMMHPRDSAFRMQIWKELYYQFVGDYKNRFGRVSL